MSDRFGLPKEGGYIESYYTIGQRKNVLNLAKDGEPVNNQFNPSPEQLETAGYILMVAVEYDPVTQKLGRDKKHGAVGHPEIIDLTPEKISANLLSQWQARMDAHDAKWTPRMREDLANVTSGRKTLQELRDAANVNQLPFEWWLEEKEIIREDRP